MNHPVTVLSLPMTSVLLSTDPLASMDSAASLVTSDTSLTRPLLLDGLGKTDGVPLPARLGRYDGVLPYAQGRQQATGLSGVHLHGLLKAILPTGG